MHWLAIRFPTKNGRPQAAIFYRDNRAFGSNRFFVRHIRDIRRHFSAILTFFNFSLEKGGCTSASLNFVDFWNTLLAWEKV